MITYHLEKLFLILILIFAIEVGDWGQISHKQIEKLHLPWIHFDWQGDSLAHRYFDKAAITIPVKIDSLPYNFNMQFDLGAQTTMLYEKSIASYLQLEERFNKKLDTMQTPVFINGQPCPLFQHVNMALDKVVFSDLSIALYKNFGDPIPSDSVKTFTSKHIGTIAPDLFQNKILLIDYPNQRICIIDSLPGIISRKTHFTTIKVEDGRIKLPFTINSKQYDILFDTGSSIFSVLTSKDNSTIFTTPNQPVVDSIVGEQWGQKIVVYGKKITSKVSIGLYNMPKDFVYYLPSKSEKALEDELKIVGLTGNAYFLKNILIIDYKNKLFGIYK
jgi:hypothetical protein